MRRLAITSQFFARHPLTRDAHWRAWARFAAWQLRSRFQSEIIHPWIEGQRLAIRRGMTGATGNVYAGLHEFTDMMLLLHFLRADDLFLDVGANVGSYTVLASGVRRARTWAFEPHPDTVAALRRNVELNRLQDNVEIFELALGSRDGEVLFSDGFDTMNHVVSDPGGKHRVVRSARLDSIAGDAHPLMIKIDVEGFEEHVIEGAGNLLASDGLQVIALETVSERVLEILGKSGFGPASYDPFTRKLSSGNTQEGSNALFLRNIDFVVARLKSSPPVTVMGRSI